MHAGSIPAFREGSRPIPMGSNKFNSYYVSYLLLKHFNERLYGNKLYIATYNARSI